MNQITKLSTLLVEFDTLKGPIIRKKVPNTDKLANIEDINSFLIWVIRAETFSVRKVKEETAYAKTFTVSDPNFNRKKRRFGLAIISPETIELAQAEQALDKLLTKCHAAGENKPYFKMLNEMFLILNDSREIYDKIKAEGNGDILSETIDLSVKKETHDEINHILLMSNRLNIFNKITVTDKERREKITVSATDNFDKIGKEIGPIKTLQSEKFVLKVDLRLEIPESLEQCLELLLRIIDVLPIGIKLKNRFIVAAEFVDRLLYEEVDIEYYLPFLQYFMSMENYTILEFKNEEFTQQVNSLAETHGEWIKELNQAKLDGKKLVAFFNLTGQRREGLELLIDLLFVKLISLF